MFRLTLAALFLTTATLTTFAHEGHDETRVALVEPGPNAPSVKIHLSEDTKSGWNLFLELENFVFSPQNAGKDHVEGEGHAHLYIDNVQVARLYGPWYHLDRLEPGPHEIMVTLNANDHRTYMIDPDYVRDIATITVKPAG